MSVQLNSLNALTQELPKQIPLKALQGAFVTAAIHMYSGSSRNMTLLGATLAASATLIDALITPFVKNLFGRNSVIGSCVKFAFFNAAIDGSLRAAGQYIGTPLKLSNIFLRIIALICLSSPTEDRRNIAQAYVF